MVIRLVLLLALAMIVVLVIARVVKSASPYLKCGKCDGLGYWEGVRMRERCDACGGSGKIRKIIDH